MLKFSVSVSSSFEEGNGKEGNSVFHWCILRYFHTFPLLNTFIFCFSSSLRWECQCGHTMEFFGGKRRENGVRVYVFPKILCVNWYPFPFRSVFYLSIISCVGSIYISVPFFFLSFAEANSKKAWHCFFIVFTF